MLKHKAWRFAGLVLLAYILSRIDWIQFGQVIKNAEIGWIIGALFLNIPALWLKSTRWKTLLSSQGKKISNKEAFLYYLSATFLGVITPGRLGEFAKAIYLKQYGITTISYGFSSVLADRLWDLFLLVLLGLLGLIILHPFPRGAFLGWVGLFLLILIIFFLFFLKRTEKISSYFYRKFLFSRISGIAKESAGQFKQGLKLIWGKKIWQSVFLTSSAYALFFLQCYFIAKGLLLPLSYFKIIPVMAMVNLFSFLPVSISGLGTRDAALLFLLGQQGISYEPIMAFSMGILFVFYAGGGLIGMIAWFLRPIELKK